MEQKYIQLIDDQLQYQPLFEKYIEEAGIIKWGKNYKLIAIIGCQSSGKSINLIGHTAQ